MKIKSYIILFCFLLLPLLFMSSMIKLAGAHEGSTGAPNEETCAKSGCHSDASVGPGDLVNKLIFNNGDSLYTPGVTYPVKIQINKTGIKRFGFQVTVLKSSDNAYVGSFVITDATRTQLQNGISPNASRKYITHKSAGTDALSPGFDEWTFNWKAPSSNVGAVKFYYATNATNMNNNNTGDQIFLSSFVVKPKISTGINDKENSKEHFHAYYSGNSHQLLLSYENLSQDNARIEIRDMSGRLLQSNAVSSRGIAVKDQPLELNAEIANGVYLVTYRVDNTMLSQKILINR